jgi:hypothetical protein
LSPSAQDYYWEARVTYEGLEIGKTYWTRVKKVYFREQPTNRLIQVSTYGDWDRNEVFVALAISTQQQVIDLLQEIAKRRNPQ